MELIVVNICNTNRDIGMKSLIIRWDMHNIWQCTNVLPYSVAYNDHHLTLRGRGGGKSTHITNQRLLLLSHVSISCRMVFCLC